MHASQPLVWEAQWFAPSYPIYLRSYHYGNTERAVAWLHLYDDAEEAAKLNSYPRMDWAFFRSTE